MSPLLKGKGNIRKNVQELMTGPVGATRQKAIQTIAKKNNISRAAARFKQARAISISQGRKK
jgi:hypothetical protein